MKMLGTFQFSCQCRGSLLTWLSGLQQDKRHSRKKKFGIFPSTSANVNEWHFRDNKITHAILTFESSQTEWDTRSTQNAEERISSINFSLVSLLFFGQKFLFLLTYFFWCSIISIYKFPFFRVCSGAFFGRLFFLDAYLTVLKISQLEKSWRCHCVLLTERE